jgi:outer membrane protein OmpA-like peptidoglycan-associated protein
MRHSIAIALICAGLVGCSRPDGGAVCPSPESGLIVLIENGLVFFDTGSARLNQRAVDYLDRRDPAKWFICSDQVDIIGHTDRSGSPADNLTLSLRRAEVVRDALIARGAPKALFVVVRGVGEDDPLILTADGVAEPQNNFVEITPR